MATESLPAITRVAETNRLTASTFWSIDLANMNYLLGMLNNHVVPIMFDEMNDTTIDFEDTILIDKSAEYGFGYVKILGISAIGEWDRAVGRATMEVFYMFLGPKPRLINVLETFLVIDSFLNALNESNRVFVLKTRTELIRDIIEYSASEKLILDEIGTHVRISYIWDRGTCEECCNSNDSCAHGRNIEDSISWMVSDSERLFNKEVL
jgi:hypothetical protein